MRQYFLRTPACTMLLGVLFIAACGSTPSLVSKTARTPDGIDFSGQWQVRHQDSGRRLSETPGIREEFVVPGRRNTARKDRGGSDRSVQVFLEFGESLKITQTSFGIFISYDRSIVEEFTFGENRVVTIGPIEALRASGWEGDRFVVETLDEGGSLLRESWEFGDSSDVLIRNIHIGMGEKEIYSRQQVFDRD